MQQLFRVGNLDSKVLSTVYKVPAVTLSLHYSIVEVEDTTIDGGTAELHSYFGVADHHRYCHHCSVVKETPLDAALCR